MFFFLLSFFIGKFFALFIGTYKFKYLPLPYKLILLLIVIGSFCEFYGYYIFKYAHKPNAWLFNLYMIVEVWLLGIAAIYLTSNKTIKNIFLSLLILNSIAWITIITTNSIYVFANVSMVCGCSIITVMYIVILYSNGLFSGEKILNQPIFWLCISTILYFGCDIPYMGLHNYITKHLPGMAKQFDYINATLDIIRYPLVAISFILLGRRKQVDLKSA